MYTGLGKLSIQSEKWRSGVVMFLNVKFCYEIQHFCAESYSKSQKDQQIDRYCQVCCQSRWSSNLGS
ncbi:MAG: hypothetical protein EWV40_03905 [Microcystis flos-aquae Mf_WU_F_19750830_S460]|uniref:Uncharacterized protein n=1 Tax=Microcystis flos-aquae Mf_WU_F_19750830_S460 TaxID=2486237 RepID=A0A552M0B9_9CHRO|nr:MAG: hypothetical protein EWV40_03905 [Microcystis flos-aquae Mf_WU_F_19750830_S460]